MGYRHKIGILDKEKHNVFKSLDMDEMKLKYGDKDNDYWISFHELTNEVFDLGKYYDDSFLKQYSFPIFENEEVNHEANEEDDFYGITKEGFLALIEDQRRKVISYFKEFSLDNWDEETIAKAQMFFKDKLFEWGDIYPQFKPYNLDEGDIVSSWKYEYSIFELVRIYRSVDWDKQIVTITAW